MRNKSNDVYLEGTNTKAIAILVVVGVIIATFIGIALIINLVSPSDDPHNIEVINFSNHSATPTITPSVPISTNSNLKIHFLNVGQADCALIEHNGEYAFIDVGKSTKGTYYSTIQTHTPSEAQWILASHQDSDHIGNMVYVISSTKVDNFYDNGVSTDTLTYRELMDKISAESIDYRILHEGDTIDTWDDVKINVVAVNSSGGSDLNDDSIVLRLEYDGVVVGFTGDISEDVDGEIGKKLGDVDVLKVAHHGANTSSSSEFLTYVRPEVSVISVGDNSYGHPSEEAISRLSSYGSVYRTDDPNGTGCVELIISDGAYKITGCEYV